LSLGLFEKKKAPAGGPTSGGALRDFFSATLICFLGSTKCLNVNSSGGDSDDYLKKSFFEPYLKIELG